MKRVAIIGAGVGVKHLAAYRVLSDHFRVKALCELDLNRAQAAAGSDTSIRITSRIGEILADSSIDIVDICLPPRLHFPITVRALEAGKHVICEKPIVLSLDEVDRLETAAKEHERKVFPVFQYRYGPGMEQLKALQNAGLAGKAYVASIETHWNRGAEYYAVPWRGTLKGESGGALFVHAIHVHDLLSFVLGPVAEVVAMADTRVNDIETEDCAALAFRMANGALATSSVTLGASDDTTRLRFCFEGFTAESGSAPYAPAEDNWCFRARSPVAQSQVEEVISAVHAEHAGYTGFLNEVANAIDGRGGAEVTLADGRRSIELATSIYESIRGGTTVRLPPAKLEPESRAKSNIDPSTEEQT